ncbi:tRNA-modifying protein YgfZ [Aliiglaciecola sp. LCG003]|uniref:tRNA-modifying protein YgfZ n=1 Tax=Aliiglaciecola sp. LCG003 TaxID=3053655 RepID=UPI0025748707|nr:tRNA-modifying protein YgfZ [Aliiglaciecola sp. LCG003]WJG10483.1 tRNA-modifying protein YgfZ [Aliiglaciecola sp. LCG003]
MQSSFNPSDNLLCELTQLGIISVTGPDAISYLQGKLTVDVAKLPEDFVQLGCHCDFKGKTWNIFYTLKSDQQIELLCHQQSLTDSLAELKKYGVFSKAEFADTSADWQIFGVVGESAQTVLANQFGTLPTDNLATCTNELGRVIRLDSPVTRYLVIAKAELAAKLGQALGQYTQSEQFWEALDIQAGIANIQTATSAEFVPQMMNMQALGAISFDKGCYMGQEVVARTKYLGKNKRAAFILKSDTAADLKAGDMLEAQVGENWRRSGTVLRCAMLEKQTWVLAVLPNDTQRSQILRSKDNPEQQFVVQPLPYTLD